MAGGGQGGEATDGLVEDEGYCPEADGDYPGYDDLVSDLLACNDEERLPFAIARIARYCPTFADQYEILKRLAPADFPAVSRHAHSVAQYYYRAGNGGAERVMTELASLFKLAGKHSMVLVGCDTNGESYLKDDGVQIEVLPEALEEHPDPHVVQNRLEKLRLYLRAASTDAYICHQWVSLQAVWDLLLCKMLGIRFILVTHGVFSFSVAAMPFQAHFSMAPYEIALCDAVVCLSQTNRFYYSKFNSNAFCLPNPLTEEFKMLVDLDLARDYEERFCYDTHEPIVLWVGRFEPGKRPEDAIKIMARVVAEYPNAKLLFVGKSEDGDYEMRLKEQAESAGIADSVVFAGYSNDMGAYYVNASMLLFTSEIEGYPMVLLEAASTGTPVVMYDLPYLATAECRDWIYAVPKYDVDAAASKVIEIVGNKQVARKASDAAREYALSIRRFDFAGEWEKVLTCPPRQSNVFEVAGAEGSFWSTLFECDVKRARACACEHSRADRLENALQSVRSEFEDSSSWRVGRAVTALPRKLLGRG